MPQQLVDCARLLPHAVLQRWRQATCMKRQGHASSLLLLLLLLLALQDNHLPAQLNMWPLHTNWQIRAEQHKHEQHKKEQAVPAAELTLRTLAMWFCSAAPACAGCMHSCPSCCPSCCTAFSAASSAWASEIGELGAAASRLNSWRWLCTCIKHALDVRACWLSVQ